MKRAFEDFCIICFLVWMSYALSGCSTFKDMARYRANAMDKCDCASAWGCSPMGDIK